MPLPTDERIIARSNEMLQKFEALFGAHPGSRSVYAKGIMLITRQCAIGGIDGRPRYTVKMGVYRWLI